MSRFLAIFAILVAFAGAARAERPIVVASDAELRFLNRINIARAERGLPALIRDARLESLARFHSADMAMNGFVALSSPDAGSLLDRAAVQGRADRLDVTAQVASGSDLGAVGEPLLDPSVTRVGVGIVEQNGRLWVTQLAVAEEPAPAYAGRNGLAAAKIPDLVGRLRLALENLGVPMRLAFLWR